MNEFASEQDEYFKKFCMSHFNDLGYRNCYLFAKKVSKLNHPSLYLITFCFVIIFLKNKKFKDGPNKNKIIEILEECRKVNKVDLFIFENGQWDKNKYYNFLYNLFEKNYILLCSSEYIYDDFCEYQELLMRIFNSTISNETCENRMYPLFDDIIGLDEAKKEVYERVVKPIYHREIYKKYGVESGGGILLFGLPGTGKTLFAQAVANEVDGYFINVKSSDIKSKWFGETEFRIKEIFDTARKHKVSVIFFDEFEGIGVSRDKLGNEITSSTVVPELLTQMQGFDKKDNIILVIASTNRPWDIDSALLRPGRFDSLIHIDLPNCEARKKMFKKFLSNINVEENLITILGEYTTGYNGADIKDISEKLIRIVISKEINGIKDYNITISDCKKILDKNKSSVSETDEINMNIFFKKYNYLRRKI